MQKLSLPSKDCRPARCETIWLQRLYVLFFIEAGSRRLDVAGKHHSRLPPRSTPGVLALPKILSHRFLSRSLLSVRSIGYSVALLVIGIRMAARHSRDCEDGRMA